MAERQGSGGGGGATRKLKWLAAIVVAIIALYSGVWAYLAYRLDEGAATAIARAEAEGTAIACEGRDVRGYPFRLGLHCEATGAELRDGTVVRAGAFRSAAQIYDPGLVIGELDGPLAVDGRAGPVRATWDVARASARLDTERLNDGRLDVSDVGVTAQAGGRELAASIARVRAFVRPNAGDLDVAATVTGLDPAPVEGRDAPPIDLDVDATLVGGAEALRYGAEPVDSLRGRTVRLRAADAVIAGGGRLGASGEVAVDAGGLASGTIELAFTDLAATADALASLAPGYEGPIRTVAGLLGGGVGGGGGGVGGLLSGLLGGGTAQASASGEADGGATGEGAAGESDANVGDANETRVTVTLDAGRARLGIIPLGTVPPLP